MSKHSTAAISDGAQIDATVEIGPYAVIGPNVKIGAGTKVGAHAVIDGHTTIGENCHIFAGAAIGLEPQDLKYKGEPTGVIIGNNNVIREFVTIHRATHEGNTIVGDNCFIMAYCHIAHNCKVGDGVIMANATTFGGYVEVGNGAIFGGMVVVHQNTTIGRLCMLSGMTGARVDLPPFSTCDGRPAMVRGLNIIGMRRSKMGSKTRAALKQAFKLLYKSGMNYSQAIEKIESEMADVPEAIELCQFYKNSKRGVAVAMSSETTSTATRELGEFGDEGESF